MSTRAELEQLAELVLRHDMTVISDEIHADLTYAPHVHIPIASLSSELAERTTTIYSATKAFNIAGLRTALAHVGPASIRQAWDGFPPDLFGATNVLGIDATLAAWEHGDEWLGELVEHLTTQRSRIDAELRQPRRPNWRCPEASYLAWLDFGQLDLPDEPAEFLRRHAAIELSPGLDFASDASGWARLNFATSRPILDDILQRMGDSLLL